VRLNSYQLFQSRSKLSLRPVTFRHRQAYTDGSKPLNYGLIAEEVAEVYPDLVVKGKDGPIQTVQYQKLTPMLLNEMQKQRAELEQQDETIRRLQARLAALEALLSRVPTTPQHLTSILSGK
jgi:Chaperone of endosialidase